MAYGGIQVPRTRLSVNISPIAALQAERGGNMPDPVEAAVICAKTGCNSIAVHLREDRRCIRDKDVLAIKKTIRKKFTLEISLSKEMVDIAKRVKPDRVTILSEENGKMALKRGLDVREHVSEIRSAIESLHDQNIQAALFVEPDIEAIEFSKECGADFVEINTGGYSSAVGKTAVDQEIDRIYRALECASQIRIMSNAGGGLDYRNVVPLLNARELLEVNIGRAIIARSDPVGLETAVEEMMEILD